MIRLDGITSYYNNAVKLSGTNDIKFVSKNNNSAIDFESFLKLLTTQLQNQDFMNPVNDSENMAQMAQLSILQQMQEVTKNSRHGYAASLLGKVVSVSTVSEKGITTVDTGYVDGVSLKGDELKIIVNGSSYAISDITHVYDPAYYLTEQYGKGNRQQEGND